jgi:hypothetical protein
VLATDIPSGLRRTDKREKRLSARRSCNKYCNYNSVIKEEEEEEEEEKRESTVCWLEEMVYHLFSIQ